MEGQAMAGVEGRVAAVTGAAQGIGAATAARLASGGAKVAVLDLDEAHATEVANALPTDAIAIACDVSDPTQVDRAFAEVVSAFGRVDVLVNNAGVTRDNLLFKMTEADFDTVIATHLKGAFLCTKAVQALMVEQRYGRIVFLSSRSALGNRGQFNYAAAKAGVQGMARTAAIELGPFGITANAVAPGFIETAMTRSVAERTGVSWQELVASAAAAVAVRRTGQPEDVANVIAFLAAEESGFVTGQTIYVTGSPTG